MIFYRKFIKFKKFFLILLNSYFIKSLINFRVAPSLEHRKVMSNIDPDLCIDVGANKGQFSLLFRSMFKSTYIFAFEPEKEAYSSLSKLFAKDEKHISYNFALGNKSERVPFYISKKKDSSSILKITELQNYYFKKTEFLELSYVDVLTGSDIKINSKRALLKIDVQGFELEVLKGLARHFNKIQWIIIEVSFKTLYENQPLFPDILLFLSTNGFKIKNLYNMHYHDDELIQCDVFLEKY